jgi:hypothetical protein
MTMASDLALLEAAGVKFIDGQGLLALRAPGKTHEPAKRKPKKDYELLERGRLRHQDGAQYPYTLGPKASRAMIFHIRAFRPFRK